MAFVHACKPAVGAMLSGLGERKAERVLLRKVNASVSESFPRQLRLTRAIDFQQVFKNNIRIDDDCVTFLVGKNAGNCPRIGFAIARKQAPGAVRRNSLKRLFRESFRKNRHRLPPRDIVVMVRREILLTRPADLRALLDQHWNSIIEQCERSC